MASALGLISRISRWLFGAPALPDVSTEPTNWCLIGNVIDEHPFGESKEIRHGSKHFAPGTKVYCLPSQWGDGYEKVIEIGMARKPKPL